jgi:hypothetical protein
LKEIFMAMQKLFTYTVEDGDYQNAKLFHVDRDDSASGVLAGIQNPANTNYVLYTAPTTPISEDPIVHSYLSAGNLRFIVGKIVTDPEGQPSITCDYTELSASYTRVGRRSDIPLQYGGNPAATDPHGFAQIGQMLYIVDYDSTKIWLLDAEALATPPATGPLTIGAPIDAGTVLPVIQEPGYEYHGNGIVAIKNGSTWYLFVLFIVSDDSYPLPPYLDSHLVRIKLSGTTAVEIVQIPLGATPQFCFNAVDMDVVDDANGNPVLLISAIGGPQKGGETNGTASRIIKVYNIFSSPFTRPGNTAVLITGNAFVSPNPTAYDFRSLTVGNNGTEAFILTGYFNDGNYTGFNWNLYRISITDLLGLTNVTISVAVSSGKLNSIGDDTMAAGYYWGIMAGGGRLLFIRGSDLVIMTESNPSLGNTVTFYRGTGTGQIGGLNINSLDFTEATLQQITYEQLDEQLTREGKELPHRRHHHHHHHHHLAQIAAKAAQAAARAAQAGETAGSAAAEEISGTGK